MKNSLKLEELVQFLFALYILISMDSPWWIYLLLLLGPDIGMLGYLVNSRVGAVTYNLLHHKALALLVLFIGLYGNAVNLFEGPAQWDVMITSGIIIYGHASMDRIFGYGLKFGDSFQHTHLGWIGKGK